MKRLILVRHAMSEDRKEGVPDISRTLVKEGIKEAVNAAKSLKGRVSGCSPSVVFISSPADRALETANLFARKLHYPKDKILLKESVYSEPSSKSFLTMIKKVEDSYDTAVVFGHNPSISEWASLFVKEFKIDLPKSGIVALEFSHNSWKEIEKQTGLLAYFNYSKESPKKTKEFQKGLSLKLVRHITEWLKGINPEASKRVSKSLEKHTDKIIKTFLKNLNRKTVEKQTGK